MPKVSMVCLLATLVASAALQATAAEKEKKVPAVLNFKMKALAGKEVPLSKYQGKVVLIVNVASECGLTPQYEQLQALHDKYGKKGLAVIGFPCNQFGQQEPGSAKQIQQFCTKNYGVEFDLFDKVEVTGDGACELYKHLTKLKTKPKGSGDIGWNFEKFLVNRKGEVVARFEPRMRPDAEEVVKSIEDALEDK